MKNELLLKLDQEKRKIMAEQLQKLDTSEIIEISMKSAESFSNTFKLPLKIKGVMISKGHPRIGSKYYTADALEKAVENNRNRLIPIIQDHHGTPNQKYMPSTTHTIGKVDRIKYNKELELIEFWGHINSETAARNILDGLFSQVSVTAFSDTLITEENGREAINIVFTELSTIYDGADPLNKLEVA